MGAKAKTTSFQGPYTREDGFLGYNEICEEQNRHSVNDVDSGEEEEDEEDKWVVEWEVHQRAPFMHKGLKWVSYDDEDSIEAKSRFAADQGLAGVMVWSVDTDDFRGNCGRGRFPLLRAINRVLYEHENGIGGGNVDRAASVAVVTIGAVLLAVGL